VHATAKTLYSASTSTNCSDNMLANLLLAVVTAFAAGAASFPALSLGRWQRAAVLLVLSIPIFLSPLLIAAEAPFLRFLASVTAVMLLVKLYDLHVGASRGLRPDLRTFLLFLPSIFSVVLRKLEIERRLTTRQNLVHFAQAIIGMSIGSALLIGLFLLDWHERPFAFEHCAKVIALFTALIPTTVAAAAVWRLFGGKARDFMDRPYLARTPADFWRRYNRPAQQFFYEDIFKRIGGLRSPIRATLITFAVSAIIHEYVFGIAIGRVQGYQTLFFMIQGCAVAATIQIRPKSRNLIPWIAGTLLFNLATSVLFFASLNGVVRFYSRGLPAWLQCW
jgi:hypothetical protein